MQFSSIKFGQKRSGGSFGPIEIELVWRKGRIIPGVDPAVARLDACGAMIRRDAYGNTTSGGAGWEIDHIMPVTRGGGDEISNLQPLQWQNNRHKADNPPGAWSCLVRRMA